jgi:xanthine dehydrogenase molybdenum-binding subunit
MGGNSANYGMGHLFARAGKMLKDAILKRAAGLLAIPVADLNIEKGMIVRISDHTQCMTVKKLSYNSIVVQKGASEHISVTARYSATVSPLAAGVVMADVRVDTETGDIFVDKLQMCHDCGRAINPMGVEGQLQGGGIMGYGYSLFEDLAIGKDGGIHGNNFNTYKLPSALDIPDLDIIIFEDPCPAGPFGAKGIGQSGTIGLPGAIYGAIYDATGIWLNTMPWIPEKLLSAIEKKGLRKV